MEDDALYFSSFFRYRCRYKIWIIVLKFLYVSYLYCQMIWQTVFPQSKETSVESNRVVTTTTNSNKRPFCDGYDIAGNRNAISRAIYAPVMPNTNGIWIYPVRCMVVNYTGVGCAEEQGNNYCQWRSNLASGFLLFMLFDDSMMNILKLLPYDRLSFC